MTPNASLRETELQPELHHRLAEIEAARRQHVDALSQLSDEAAAILSALAGAAPGAWRAEDSLLAVWAMYIDLQGNLEGRELARGWLRDDEALYTGKVNGQFVDEFPFPIGHDELVRGQQRFNIYCTPCHGRVGDGNGMVVQRGLRQVEVLLGVLHGRGLVEDDLLEAGAAVVELRLARLPVEFSAPHLLLQVRVAQLEDHAARCTLHRRHRPVAASVHHVRPAG